MTSSSEEDASRGVEGLDAAGGRSESVTYPRFFLVGMTSSSDSSSPLTGAGAGAGAGNASGTGAGTGGGLVANNVGLRLAGGPGAGRA